MKTINEFLAQTKRHELADGRFLAYLDLGDRNGRPIFFFHGLPGSRVEAIALHESAQKHGYRIIAPDRPGLGDSTPQLNRVLLDWPQDVTALADALEYDKFSVLGVSGGGPFALACAYAIPDRLDVVVDAAGSAPIWTDPAARREISSVDRFFSSLGKYLPTAFMRPPFAYIAYRARKMQTGRQFVKFFGNAISEPDQKLAVVGENGRLLIRDIQVSFQQGTKSVAEETMLNYKPWGFALADITMPVYLFHGTEDKLVPFSFGEFKARSIPHTVFTSLPEHGHFYPLLNAIDLLEKHIPV